MHGQLKVHCLQKRQLELSHRPREGLDARLEGVAVRVVFEPQNPAHGLV